MNRIMEQRQGVSQEGKSDCMKRLYETAVIFIGTLGWWGFVYPDLCLTQEAYEESCDKEMEIAEEQTDQKDSQAQGEETDGVLQGVRIGGLRIKSRFVEYVYQVKENEKIEKESENEK